MIENLVSDVHAIIEEGVVRSYAAVNVLAALTYWRVGRRIVEEEQGGADRAEYGAHLIDDLASSLFPIYGERYSARRLRDFRQFYQKIPDFEIWHSRVPNLTWTHIRQVLSVVSDDARYWYLREASREGWSARTLSRNVGSQYYQRLLKSPKKDAVIRVKRNFAGRSNGKRKSLPHNTAVKGLEP